MILIDGESLKIEDIVKISREKEVISIKDSAKEKILMCREQLMNIVEKDELVYGLNTGFGSLANTKIPKEEAEILQNNIIKSHACAVGKPLPEEVVRAAMVIRINTLSKGFSGIRLEVLEELIDMVNRGVCPIIPEKGSVGASGDLAPLSHMVLVMLGEGEAYYNHEKMKGIEALKKAEIEPIQLSYKEGLALTNGTSIMTAIASLCVYDAKKLLEISEISAALSLESLKGRIEAFDNRIHDARNHEGQKICAEKIRKLVEGSKLINSNKEKIQDSYSLRCIPQVHGSIIDVISFVEKTVNKEINAATDNPLIFDGQAISGGNFHGEPIAFAMDFLGIALSELANISERRTAKLVDKNQNDGLPAFLIEKNGLNSGLMIPQYIAASLVSENKILAHPASVDSIPTSANQEDHVSMGTIAARKAREILWNTKNVIAIELLTASQAAYIRGPENLGQGTKKAYDLIRENIPPLKEDRILYGDINKIVEMIDKNVFSSI